MVINSLRSLIIIIGQCLLPVALLVVLTSQLDSVNQALHQLATIFRQHQAGLFITHSFFYISLWWLCPFIIQINLNDGHDREQRVAIALRARCYLLATLGCLELLLWWP